MKTQTLLITILAILFTLSISIPLTYAGPTMWVDDVYGNIGTVDVSTGTTTVIGNAGVQLTDIAFDGSGNLYGITFDTLYSINKTTAAAAPIGNLGVGQDVNGLTFSSGGTLYASGASGNLYTVNTSTGAATALFDTGFASGGDLAFNNGVLYYTDGTHLLSIDLTAETASSIGVIGPYPVYGLATLDDGMLYAAANTSIYSVNTTTGAGTLTTTFSGLGQAWGATTLPIPEPSTFLLLVAGLAGIGFLRRRRMS